MIEYKCEDCGATGVKLWRPYQTFLENIKLLCARCACASEGRTDLVGADGRIVGKYDAEELTDQIGWYLPAVPTEDGDTFWGYSSVPQDGVEWWRRLPTYSTIAP